MVQRTGWRTIFMVNVPVGIVVLLLTWRFVAEWPKGIALGDATLFPKGP